MKNLKTSYLLTTLAVLTSLGCSHAPKAEPPPEAPVAAKTEKAASKAQAHSSVTHLLPSHETTLENGLKIIFINDPSLPRVSFTLLAKVGALQDPKEKEGLNFVTARLFEQGTQSKSATVLADALGQLGTEISIEPSRDFTIISMDALTNSADKLLDLYSDMILNPAFTDGELARIRAQILAEQQKKMDDPSSYSSEKFAEFLYGDHPYAFDLTGTPKSIRKITKQDVIRHYLTTYRPNNAMLAVVGRFDKDFETKVGEAFSKWHSKPIKDVVVPELKTWTGVETKLISKAGLQQAQIRIGEFSIRRNDPDYLKLRLANMALGGEFGSLLNQHVRYDLGLTYSIDSVIDARWDRGAFYIDTFTKNETIGKTVDETLKVLNDFVAKGLNEEEFKSAKEQLIGQFPRAIETADRYAYNLLALNFYGVSPSYLQDFTKNVQALTLAEVNETIKKDFSSENLRILIYADEKKAGDQLKAYKPVIEKAR